MKKYQFIVLLLVAVVLFSCSGRYYSSGKYYAHLFDVNWHNHYIENDYGTMYGADYENEIKFDSTYYVSDSLSGVFGGIKGTDQKVDLSTFTYVPDFKNPCVEVRLQLNNDGTGLFSESFYTYFRGNGYGKWCVKDSMIYLLCDGKPHLENKLDSTSYVLAMFRFRYKMIDAKILDNNRLQLKNGTVLYRQ